MPTPSASPLLRVRASGADFVACVAMALVVIGPALPPWEWGRLDDSIDGRFLAWVIAWGRAWTAGAGGAADDGRGLFDAPIFHPDLNALAYSEHCVGLIPFSLVLWPFTGTAGRLFHAQIVLQFALSAWAVGWLARRVTRSRGAGWAAALLWLCAAAHLLDMGRFVFHVVWGVALMWIGLERFVTAPTARRGAGWLALAAGAAVWQATISLYIAQFVVFGLVVAAGVLLVWAPGGRSGRSGRHGPDGRGGEAGGAKLSRRWRVVVGAAVIGAAVVAALVPILLFYWRASEGQQLATPSFLRRNSLQPQRMFVPGMNAYQYVGWGRIVLAMAGLALVVARWRRSAPRTRRWWWLVLIASGGALTLGFGPAMQWDGRPVFAMPYEALRRVFPTISAFRVVYRWEFPATIGLALLGAVAVTRLVRVVGARSRLVASAAGALIVALLVWETWAFVPLRTAPPIERLDARAVEMLRAMPADTVVADITLRWQETSAMIRQTRHWRPLVQGYSGYGPPTIPGRNAPLLPWPRAIAERAAVEMGVDVIVVSTERLRRAPDLDPARIIHRGEAMTLLRALNADELPPPALPPIDPSAAPLVLTMADATRTHGVEHLPDGRLRSYHDDPNIVWDLAEPLPRAAAARIVVRAIVDGPPGARGSATLYWGTNRPPLLEEYGSLRLPISFSPQSQELVFNTGALPAWSEGRPLTALRFDPANAEGLSVTIESVTAESATKSTKNAK